MGALSEYVYALLIVSSSAAVITVLLPRTSRLSGHIHFLVGIVVTSVLLMPMLSAFGKLPQLTLGNIDFDVADCDTSQYTQAVIDEAELIMEMKISDELTYRFNTTPSRVKVHTNGKAQDLTVYKAEVYYKGRNGLLFSDTVKYIKDILGAECEVTVSAEDDQP